MLQNGLSSRLSDLDEEIQQSYRLDIIPRDTSQFSDEKLIKYIEERNEILEKISTCKKNIYKLENTKKNILISFSNLPDCELKKMIKMHFFDGEKYSRIGESLGYAASTIGFKLRAFLKYNLLEKGGKIS